MHSLGRALHRWAYLVALGWLLLIVLAFAVASGSLGGQSLFERLQAGDAPTVPGESRDGRQALIDAGDDTRTVLMIVDGVDATDPDVAASVERARAGMDALAHVTGMVDPYLPLSGGPDPADQPDQQDQQGQQGQPAGPGQPDSASSPFVAAGGTAILVSVALESDLEDPVREATVDAVEIRLAALGEDLAQLAPPGEVDYRIGGVSQLVDEVNHLVEQDLRVGEAVALPLSLLVMVVVFGGLLAAGLPIIGAIASIGGGLAILLGFSYAIELDASVPSVVSVLGLGLCIDYGLLLVSRYREELRRISTPDGYRRKPRDFRRAMERTLGSAGRTVLFSGLTVAISLCGLLFFRTSILQAVGAAGVSVVVVAVLVALTLVPALLVLAGDRVLRPGITHRVPGLRRMARRLGDVSPPDGVFSRLAARVQRRPILVGLGALAVLVVAALPALRIEMVASGVSLLPASNEQRLLFEDLAERFPATAEAPILVVSSAAPQELTAWAAPLADLDGVRSLERVRTVGEGDRAVSVVGVQTDTDPRLSPAREVVDGIREHRAREGDPAGGQVWVTGETAEVHDFVADIIDRAPLAIAVVVLATFTLLFLMTGSLLIPLKALMMNAVSLGASFGVLVWVFQQGNLEGLLDFTSNGGIDQNIPALALAFAFGLSMDYEVFLLSRIKEVRDGPDGDVGVAAGATPGRTPLNDLAVRRGLQRSGRIITSAALIIVIVFAGFVAGEMLLIKQMGVALAVAVAVDATIVRMLLVPATMTLLGEWNWWAPGPLRRLHARFGLSEG